MYIYTCTYTRTHTHTHTHVHIYIHIHIYTNIYTHLGLFHQQKCKRSGNNNKERANGIINTYENIYVYVCVYPPGTLERKRNHKHI